ncbi:MAG: S24/S26 family peptidase [Bacteroidales bacterium]|nr:S24/S26 family peptidase [Bacteroidales bacterium]
MEVFWMSDINDLKLDLLLEQLGAYGTAEVRANGSSMKPFIRKGDLLTLQRKTDDPCTEGEIVAFVKDKLVYIHRLIRIDLPSGLVLTKGDHLEISDAMIKQESLIARVVGVNGQKIHYETGLHASFFKLYCYSMTLWNSGNSYHGKILTRIYLTSGRFKLTKAILKLCNWATRPG